MMGQDPRLAEEAARLNSDTRGELDTPQSGDGPPPSIREHPPAQPSGSAARRMLFKTSSTARFGNFLLKSSKFIYKKC